MKSIINEHFVFPACAGVILFRGDVAYVVASVPRMRGGDPRV